MDVTSERPRYLPDGGHVLPATMLVQFWSVSHLGLPAGRWGRILDGHTVRKPRAASMLDTGAHGWC